jgi:hypothetical protein
MEGDAGASCTSNASIVLMEAVRTSETSISFNKTTRQFMPEGCYINVKYLPKSKSASTFIP